MDEGVASLPAGVLNYVKANFKRLIRRSHLLIRFQFALFWSTSLLRRMLSTVALPRLRAKRRWTSSSALLWGFILPQWHTEDFIYLSGRLVAVVM